MPSGVDSGIGAGAGKKAEDRNFMPRQKGRAGFFSRVRYGYGESNPSYRLGCGSDGCCACLLGLFTGLPDGLAGYLRESGEPLRCRGAKAKGRKSV